MDLRKPVLKDKSMFAGGIAARVRLQTARRKCRERVAAHGGLLAPGNVWTGWLDRINRSLSRPEFTQPFERPRPFDPARTPKESDQ